MNDNKLFPFLIIDSNQIATAVSRIQLASAIASSNSTFTSHNQPAIMCIIFFRSHHDGPREHLIGSHHCAHLDCPGTFEAHHKFLLEEPRLDCVECVALDGDEIDPVVRYYSPIPYCDLECIDGKWVKVVQEAEATGAKKGAEGTGPGTQANAGTDDIGAGGQDEEDEDDEVGSYHSFRSLSDVDSVTSHWRLGPLTKAARRTAAAAQETSPAPFPRETSATEEPYETRSAHDPHEMSEVGEPYYENATNQDPNIPDVSESPFDNSPNTRVHRNLVNQQLATLTHHMGQQPRPNGLSRREMMRQQRAARPHRRQNSQPGFGVPRPQQYALSPPGNQGPPEEQFYTYTTAPQAGLAPTWGWGPVPQPHLRTMYPPVSLFGSCSNNLC
jgi:hypothetical protein